jgi:hypothetical protein
MAVIVPPARSRHTFSSMRQWLTALSLFCAGCGLPALTSEDVFGLEPLAHAWVYGVVIDDRAGAPLANATLQMASASTRSDANGAFRLGEQTAGSGELVVSREGFEPFGETLELRAGANRLEVRLTPLSCGACGSGEICGPGGKCIESASVSGDIIDACTRAAVEARVTIDGKSTCSFQGKGYWQLTGLTPGAMQTVAAGKTGYQAFSAEIELKSGFNALPRIELTPVGGCSAPSPSPSTCTCTTPNCQP